MFNSKYPIIALGMNQVSNLSLALAVSTAGAIPTISGFNYVNSTNIINRKLLEKDFNYYEKDQGKCNFVFSIDDKILQKNKSILLEIFIKYSIQYLEVIIDPVYLESNYSQIVDIFVLLKTNKIKLLTKILSFNNFDKTQLDFVNYHFDGIVVKGNCGAGRVSSNSNDTLENLFKTCKKLLPNKFIIPSGGIETPVDIKKYLNLGAGAVGIGTLLAVSKESPLTLEAKEKIIRSKSSDLQKLKTYDFDQNALVFSHIDQSKTNNTKGLIEGINTGKIGHIFLGKSIDSIKQIKSVEEIILDLTNF